MVYYSLSKSQIGEIERENICYAKCPPFNDRSFVVIFCDSIKKAQECIKSISSKIEDEKFFNIIKTDEIFKRIDDLKIIEKIRESFNKKINNETILGNLFAVVPTAEVVSLYDSLWNEYNYRHNLIWKHLFQSVVAAVAVTIPVYTKSSVVNQTIKIPTPFKVWEPTLYNLLAFITFAILAYSLIAIVRELQLYDKIKQAYRDHQKMLFGIDQEIKIDGFPIPRVIIFIWNLISIPIKFIWNLISIPIKFIWNLISIPIKCFLKLFGFKARVLLLFLVLIIFASLHALNANDIIQSSNGN